MWLRLRSYAMSGKDIKKINPFAKEYRRALKNLRKAFHEMTAIQLVAIAVPQRIRFCSLHSVTSDSL